MMNPYYYLFYKLNHFLNKKGDNEWGSIFAISALIGWNIVFLYIKLFFSIFQVTDSLKHKPFIVGIAIILFSANSFLFLNEKRVRKITERYQKESEISRKLGNFIVILYILCSIGLIVFI